MQRIQFRSLRSFLRPFERRSWLAAVLAAPLCATGSAALSAAQGLLPTPPPSLAAAPAAPVSLGGPLKVGEQSISEDEIRRALVYSAGREVLESFKLDVFIDAELERRRNAGEDVSKYILTDAEFEALRVETLGKIREQYPQLDPEAVLKTNGHTMEGFVKRLTQTSRFDRLFLPSDVREWPPFTIEAIKKNMQEDGDKFIQQLIDTQEERDKQRAAGTTAAAGEQLFTSLMRNFVLGAVKQSTVVKAASDGIPADTVLVVDGKPLLTAQIYPMVAPLVSEADVTRTRTWLAKMASVEQRLKASGDALSDEEFAAVWEAHDAVYRGTLFPLDAIVLSFRRFPSMDAYKRYFRAQESFRKSIAAQITDEALQQHYDERASKVLGLGALQVEFILLSAFDFPNFRWKPNGWAEAAERAKALAAELDAGELANWSELLDSKSEFWDPPAAQGQGTQEKNNARNKGRFGSVNRNELAQRLDESEYSSFVSGSSLADYVYLEQGVGTVDGPFKGPYGYYFSRVIDRRPPTSKYELSQPTHRDLILQDFLTVRFSAYAAETLAACKVEGLD